MPEHELDLATTSLWRIHGSSYGAVYYSRRSYGGVNYRFNAADDEFGVLYASTSFDACMAEAVVRERFQGASLPLMLDEDELTSRSITSLGTDLKRPLRLADLTQPHVHLGMDNRVLSTVNYRAPNLWSSAIYRAFPDLDGIWFTSRFANEPSVAVFDRTQLIERDPPVRLDRHPLLPAWMERYGVGITPG
ncbi:RES family NAD+ phosphorylase [Pandoraea sp.]|uniref:RES family NAD+ phosphorylase n=1 Tax=Pandoraea sp. TaxID=1883445 RepID=UPI0025F95871|nr:RES family NAD+ phosphorylase [Pandoraea sp.]